VALAAFSIRIEAQTPPAQTPPSLSQNSPSSQQESLGPTQLPDAQQPELLAQQSQPELLAQAAPVGSLPSQAAMKSLLDKAHAFEARGRMDMAVQTWQQILLTTPNNPDALGGLARAAKLDGNNALANTYLERLRAINPNDPNIARTENISTQQSQAALLQQAGKLAEDGKYAEAMAIYRQIFGGNPPAGDWALAYYVTESAIEAGRPHAIAGLRALSEKYPDDSRYQIALGRILTFNPKTREEGRKILERYPKDQQANDALRQSLLWDTTNPAEAGEVRAYLATHNDPQLAEALQAAEAPKAPPPGSSTAVAVPAHQLAHTPAAAAPQQPPVHVTGPVVAQAPAKVAAPAQTSTPVRAQNIEHAPAPAHEATPAREPTPAHTPPVERVQPVKQAHPVERAQAPARTLAPAAAPPPVASTSHTRSEAEIAAYKALNEKHLVEAEELFKAVLEKEPENPRALAGMGYIRMQQGNFMGAIGFLEQAKQDNSTDSGLPEALDTARFWFIVGEGQAALNENDLTRAEKQYRAALDLRPTSLEALNGLGGTLERAQQPAAAIPFYQKATEVNATNAEAWRGLFMSQFESGDAALALATEKRIPAAPLTQLQTDSSFLRTLASANTAVGRDTDAQKALESAVKLPYPANEKSAKAETQIQLAGTLLATNRLQEAAALYSQVLADDHANTSAWQGLTRVQHAMGHDQQALATVESMPPTNYAEAMRDPGFEATVAAIYQAQKKYDVAQDLLEKAIAQQTGTGQRPPTGVSLQLAGLYVERGNSKLAVPIYQQVLGDEPTRIDAWTGLLAALHTQGQDKEVVEQLKQATPAVRGQLESNVNFLQTMAAVYGALGEAHQAQFTLNLVEQYYAAQHSAPPADIDIQNSWFLYNSADDTGLYRQLMVLGGRNDLTEEQSRAVQAIWTNWAVRRANQAAAVGNTRRALAILNAAARAFPDNPAVIKTLANGYAQAGQPEQAVLIYKAQNMASASAADYESAIGAALAASDTKDADPWLKSALAAYPNDPRILILAAKFEQQRGNTTRAIDYYRASLKAMPPPDAATRLAAELRLPAPSVPSRLPNAEQPQDLAILLAPGSNDMTPVGSATEAAPELPPTSPSNQATPAGDASGSGDGKPISQSVPNATPLSTSTTVVPPYMTVPGEAPASSDALPASTDAKPASTSAPDNSDKSKTKADGPQSLLIVPQRHLINGAVNLPSQAEVEQRVRVGVAWATRDDSPANELAQQATPTPQDDQMQQIARLTQQAAAAAHSAPAASVPASVESADLSATPARPVVAVQLGDSTPHPAPQIGDVTDVLPNARYVANTKVAPPTVSSHPEIAAAQAASIRRHQSDTDSSHDFLSTPPPDVTITADDVDVQAVASTLLAQNQLVSRPATPPTNSGSEIPDTGSQQYPQPRAAPTGNSDAARRHAVRSESLLPSVSNLSTSAPNAVANLLAPSTDSSASPAESAPVAIVPSTSSSSVVPPSVQPVPLNSSPSEADLLARNLPQPHPYYEPQAPMPLTPRQVAESGLASLEGSYSGWAGVTGIGRYRSGTPGLDRLSDVESPTEVSTVIGHSARVTAVAIPVFLNSGTLNPSSFSSGYVPYLGTMPSNSANAPAQQIVNGVGGELQLASKYLDLAAGYTPYDFIIQNETGHLNLRLFKGHVTLFGDRSPVKDTQLSYAGLRDPGTITSTYQGVGWGGVVSSTAGARIDLGSGGSGFYLSADGGDLHGYHVQNNTKYEGSTGAYLRVKNWPEIGSLTVGGGLFGMHYQRNEIGLTYGQGGYFSPDSFFLASVPVTFNGAYKSNFHYTASGAFGVQTFQQDWASFYPLDPALQSNFVATSGGSCSAAQLAAHSNSCGEYPSSASSSLNYSFNSEVSYRFGEHWYLGGFVTANNSNNYNAVSGGFFFRVTLHRQHASDGYPTGLFPTEGIRPLRVP
jgi:tetratricopeptide (TPR) repeat protein